MNGKTMTWLVRLGKFALLTLLCGVSGVIGSALSSHFGTSSYTLSYADFVSILLTAVSLLMTVLAIFLAVIGFIGWTSIEQKAHSKTEQFLDKEFENGGRLNRMLNERVENALRKKTAEIMFEGIAPIEGQDEGEESSK